MTAEDVRTRLEGVRGNMGVCPAHEDKNPSLSVQDGERGVLLRCFAGCTVAEICEALNIEISELFYDAPLSPDARRPTTPTTKPQRLTWRKYAASLEDEALSLRLRGEAIFVAAKDLSIDDWTDADLEEAWEALLSAYSDMTRADCFESLAFNLRTGGLHMEARKRLQMRTK